MTAPFCPHCGYNLVKDEVIERDGFTLDPRGRVGFGIYELKTGPSGALLLHSLAAANGRVVSREVLGERIGYEGDNNVVQVLLSRLRKYLRAEGAPVPFRNVWGRGYAWGAAA